MKGKAKNVLGNNVGKYLHGLRIAKAFLGKPQQHQKAPSVKKTMGTLVALKSETDFPLPGGVG